jgi:transcriptional regulator with PAS, ATPase and Fis domain
MYPTIKSYTMRTDEVKRVLALAREKVSLLYITGGEPLVRKDLSEIALGKAGGALRVHRHHDEEGMLSGFNWSENHQAGQRDSGSSTEYLRPTGPSMSRIRAIATKVAPSSISVLILGESGLPTRFSYRGQGE